PDRSAPVRGRGNSWRSRAPSHPSRRLHCLRAGPCKAARSSPFFGELRVYLSWLPRVRSQAGSLAEPGFLRAPAQPLGEQDLINAAALDANLSFLIQVCLQPVETPAAERLVQLLGGSERRRDHLRHLLGRIRGL